MRVIVIALVVATPAAAEPITVGAAFGVTQSRVDASSAPNPTLGVFGRFGVAHRLALQLSVARVELPTGDMLPGVDMKQADAAVIRELADGSLVPVVVAGAGVDHAQWQSLRDRVYAHGEVGLGLEWRLGGGLALGADVRLGYRTLVSHTDADVETYLEPRMLSDGEYRSARIALGVQF